LSTRRTHQTVFWICFPLLLALSLVDKLSPVGLHMTLFYPLPIYWTAWHHGRSAAWGLTLMVTVINIAVLRPLVGRPPMASLNWLNWGLFLVSTVLTIELVWRGRWYFDQVAGAMGRRGGEPHSKDPASDVA
jgi:hypothetical protein